MTEPGMTPSSIGLSSPSRALPALLRALIVADKEEAIQSLRMAFSQIEEGAYLLFVEEDHERALEKMLANDYELYLIDLPADDDKGLALLQRAVGEGCTKPILVSTPTYERTLDISAMEAGASAVLCHDLLTPARLERELRLVLAHHARYRLQRKEQERSQALEAVDTPLQIIEDFPSRLGHELSSYISAIQRKAERVLQHEQERLSVQGTLELEVLVEQCQSLGRTMDGMLAKEQKKMVSRWNFARIVGQLRLSVLRERGGRALRMFLASPSSHGILEHVIIQAARQSDISAGLEEIKRWLSEQAPPLLPSFAEESLWPKLQPILADAFKQMQSTLADAVREAPSVSQRLSPTKVNITTTPIPQLGAHSFKRRHTSSTSQRTVSSTLGHRQGTFLPTGGLTEELNTLFRARSSQLPPEEHAPDVEDVSLSEEWEDTLEHLLYHFKRLGIPRWLSSEAYERIARHELSRASQQSLGTFDMTPLWERMQRVPDLDPFLLKHYFYQVMRQPPALPLKLPALLVEGSPYKGMEELPRIDLTEPRREAWFLLELPIVWQDAVPAMVDRLLLVGLDQWCDPLLFERFLEQRLAWFLNDDKLDLIPIRDFFEAAKVPVHEVESYLVSLSQEDFPWELSPPV